MSQAYSSKTSFGTLCAAKLEAQGLSVIELVKRIKKIVPASQFTRWKQGRWTYISAENLCTVVEGISDDPREQCDLVLAYLHDLTPMKYRPMILNAQKGEAAFSITDGQAPWREPMRRKLDAIGAAYEISEDFAAMVEHMSEWARRVQAEAELKAAKKRPTT